MGISRRKVIVGAGLMGGLGVVGGWAALADRGIAPGHGVLNAALGRCDLSQPPLDAAAGPLVAGAFDSARRARSVGYVIAYPPGASQGSHLPVCLVLHGYAADERTAFDGIGYHHLLASAVNGGAAPFALASVAGGNGYWHPHPGDDPLGMVLDEFPGVLAGHGLRAAPGDRMAVLGWSMGGFGALLTTLQAPHRLVLAVANAPAFWRSYAEAHRVNPGAFDSAAGWRRWGDLVARAHDLDRRPVRIEVGAADSFAPAVRALRDRLADPSVVRITKGCHDTAFWRHHAADQFHRIGAALATVQLD